MPHTAEEDPPSGRGHGLERGWVSRLSAFNSSLFL